MRVVVGCGKVRDSRVRVVVGCCGEVREVSLEKEVREEVSEVYVQRWVGWGGWSGLLERVEWVALVELVLLVGWIEWIE
jgi:hypothetical protein